MILSVIYETLSTDTNCHLGRLDYASLSQQALMEMVIDGVVNRENICDSQENPKDISEWKGVTVNENEEVIRIEWLRQELKGTVSLEWLPGTVATALMHDNQLAGVIDLSNLPVQIENLSLGNNNLRGSLDLENVQSSLSFLSLASNALSGAISLRKLPAKMYGLWLQRNKFSGTLDFTKLPGEMQFLNISHNKFEGKADFSQIPVSLRGFDVSHTELSGEILKEDGAAYIGVKSSNVELRYK